MPNWHYIICVSRPIQVFILAAILLLPADPDAFGASCGDCNNSGSVDISDAVYLINYIFVSGQVPQDNASGDLNCNNQTEVSDVVFLVNYIFASGPSPCEGPQCEQGLLLTGDPDSTAMSRIFAFGPFATDSAEVDSMGLLTSKIEAVLNPAATVGQVNDALNSIGSRMTWMRPGQLSVTVRIPPISSREEADSLGSLLVQSGAFLYAYAAYQAKLSSTDTSRELPPTGTNEIFHLRQMRMPAAWNVKSLVEDVNNAVTVFVPDGYANSTVHPEIPSQIFIAGEGDPDLASTSGNHGFRSSGIIGAKHDDKNTTGVHPGPDDLLVIRSMMIGGLTLSEIGTEIYEGMPSGRFVLNTSFGFANDLSELSKAKRAIKALEWRNSVRSRHLDFIHISSAGNEKTNTDDSRYALLSSAFNLAAGMDSPFELYDPGEIGPLDFTALTAFYNFYLQLNPLNALPLENVIVVGSSDFDGNESSFSNPGAPVRVLGEEVAATCVREDPASVDGGCFEISNDLYISYYDGTSFAAPQVSGLVAYLLSIDPSSSNAKIKDIINSAYNNSNVPGYVDAYLAVLALDSGPGNSDVRSTLLDVTDETFSDTPNSKFDEYDVQAFLAKFDEYERLRDGVPDAPADYSRYDLNGDGFTGGDTYIARFDLNIDDPPQFTSASVPFGEGTLFFDENTLVDKDILCYYARTSLYTGIDSLAEVLLSDCPCAQTGRQESQCAGCDIPIQNLVQYVSRTGFMQANASCNDCGCFTTPGTDFLPDGPDYFFGEWTTNESASLSCTSIQPSCASSAQSTIQSSPAFDTVANRWTFTVVQSGNASYNQPCQAINVAYENWRLTIADSCAMKYTLRLVVENGELDFQGRFEPPQQTIDLQIGTFIPGTASDTTISGELAAGEFNFEYLGGHYSGSIRLEFTIEPAQPTAAFLKRSALNSGRRRDSIQSPMPAVQSE